MKYLFPLFLFSLATVCFAEQGAPKPNAWQYMTSSQQQDKYYIQNVSKNSENFDFWMKIERPALLACVNNAKSEVCLEKIKEYPISSFIYHMNMSCKTKRSKLLGNIIYGREGEVTGSQETSGKEEWDTIFPDSTMEVIYTRLCSK